MGREGPGGMTTLSWPGFPSPKPYSSTQSLTRAPLRGSQGLQVPEPLPLRVIPPRTRPAVILAVSLTPGAQRQGLLSRAAPQFAPALEGPACVQGNPIPRHVPAKWDGAWSQACEAFLGQGLALLGTAKCKYPFSASAVVPCVWSPPTGQGCANPVQSQVLFIEWPDPNPLVPSFFWAKVRGFSHGK